VTVAAELQLRTMVECMWCGLPGVAKWTHQGCVVVHEARSCGPRAVRDRPTPMRRRR
jgi:hypothetical protein